MLLLLRKAGQDRSEVDEMSMVSLSTVFAPSPSCLAANNFWAVHQGSATDDLFVQLGPPQAQGPTCYPESYSPTTSLYFASSACPTGYTSACVSTAGPAEAVQTAQICCPR